jgi:hypothetical protein
MQMTDLPTTSDNTDEWIDEVVLKPAQWQLDDYLKAKAAIIAKFDELERKHAAEIQAMLAKLLEEGRRMYTSPGVTRMSFFAVPSQVIEAELNHLTTEKKQP